MQSSCHSFCSAVMFKSAANVNGLLNDTHFHTSVAGTSLALRNWGGLAPLGEKLLRALKKFSEHQLKLCQSI